MDATIVIPPFTPACPPPNPRSLTGPADRLAPYAPLLQALATARDLTVTHQRFHIPDMGICDAAQMNHILDTIDEHVSAGRGVYVHCWGGVGRTGTVIGCWLVRHGATGDAALQQVLALFKSMSPEKWERRQPRATLFAPLHPGARLLGCTPAAPRDCDDCQRIVYPEITTSHPWLRLRRPFTGIPSEWRARLTKKPLLDRFADALVELSTTAPSTPRST